MAPIVIADNVPSTVNNFFILFKEFLGVELLIDRLK